MNNGHWLFDRPMRENFGIEGFIYVIRDDYMKRFYIGKKSYNKGENWRNYLSSGKLLKELMAARPRDEFSFIVLEEYNSPGGLSYAETWSLCMIEAPSRKDVYNILLPKISWKSKERITEKHKQRLALTMQFYEFGDKNA
jgi:hypothetical protein